MDFMKVFRANTFLFIMLLFASCNNSNNATNTALKPFQIKMEKVEDGMKFTCLKGCAWKELTYSKKKYQPQKIDEYGMVDSKRKNTLKDSEQLADFAIEIIKTEGGIQLKGEKGTAWKELAFTSLDNQPQWVSQKGVGN